MKSDYYIIRGLAVEETGTCTYCSTGAHALASVSTRDGEERPMCFACAKRFTFENGTHPQIKWVMP